MLLVAAAVGGIVIVFCGYVGYRLVSSTYYRLVSSTYYRLVRTLGIFCPLMASLFSGPQIRLQNPGSQEQLQNGQKSQMPRR